MTASRKFYLLIFVYLLPLYVIVLVAFVVKILTGCDLTNSKAVQWFIKPIKKAEKDYKIEQKNSKS